MTVRCGPSCACSPVDSLSGSHAMGWKAHIRSLHTCICTCAASYAASTAALMLENINEMVRGRPSLCLGRMFPSQPLALGTWHRLFPQLPWALSVGVWSRTREGTSTRVPAGPSTEPAWNIPPAPSKEDDPLSSFSPGLLVTSPNSFSIVTCCLEGELFELRLSHFPSAFWTGNSLRAGTSPASPSATHFPGACCRVLNKL